MQPQLFGASLVLEADRVGRAGRVVQAMPRRAPLGRSCEETTLRLVARQIPRRHLHGVVDPPGDQRIVRITIQEVHHHLLANARDVDATIVGTRPRRGDSNPARAVLVHLPIAIPVELHLHPAVLVGVDLLARRAHHHRRLRAGGVGFGGDALAARSNTSELIAACARLVSAEG